MKTLSGIAACLALLLVALPAPAEADLRPEEMVEGFTTQLGYTFHAGQWWRGGVAYTRSFEWYTVQACNSCGVYYPYRTWRAIYTPVVTVTNNTYVTPPAYTADWKTETLKTLAKRDDVIAFQNTVASINTTAVQPTYGNYGLGSYGVSGQTVYARGGFNGFTASIYNSADENLSNMLAARLTQNAQQLAGQGHGDFIARIDAQSAYAAGLEKMRIVANSGQPTPTLNATTFQFSPGVNDVKPPTVPVVPVNPMPPAIDDAVSLTGFWSNNCASCHSGPTAQKGFTLDTYRGLSRQAKIDRVWSRLVSPDPKQAMPRDKDGAGHRLSDDKLMPIFNDIKGMAVK